MIKKMNQSLLRSERDWRSAALFPPGVVPPHSIDLDQWHSVRLASQKKRSRHASTGF
jgi:hypothetical protein